MDKQNDTSTNSYYASCEYARSYLQNTYLYATPRQSLEEFFRLKDAFKKHGILFDSTVFKNGQNLHGSHYYNFKNTPNKTIWKFSNNPIIEDPKGEFIEIPIASYKISPFFFWKFVFIKKFGNSKHKSYGNGYAVKSSIKHKLKLLFSWSNTVVSIDGFKSSYLQKAFDNYIKKYNSDFHFVIIGHPKALSKFSLNNLDVFLKANKEKQIITIFPSQYNQNIV